MKGKYINELEKVNCRIVAIAIYCANENMCVRETDRKRVCIEKYPGRHVPQEILGVGTEMKKVKSLGKGLVNIFTFCSFFL